MNIKDWFTKNICVTSPNDPDPFFHPRSYPRTKAEVAQKAQEVVRSLPRWKVEEYRETQGRLHATRQTLWMRFIDDVNIYIIQGLDGVTRLEMTSQSRVGRGDFGQNRRNLKEFLTRLDAQLTPLSLQEKAL